MADRTETCALLDSQPPHVRELARMVSAASIVEPALLRRARLELVPAADVSVEADLWFGPLVQTRSSIGIVLRSDVVSELRIELAGDAGQLRAAGSLVRAAHVGQPPAVRLEEEVTLLALEGRLHESERAIERAIASLVDGRQEGLATWAAGALPRLPEAAQQTQAAQLLFVAAAARVEPAASSFPGAGPVPPGAERLLPERAPVTIGVRLAGRRLEIGPPELPGARPIELPRTEPMMLDVTHGRATTPLRWSGPQAAIGIGSSDEVTLRAVDGALYRVFVADRVAYVVGVPLERLGDPPRRVDLRPGAPPDDEGDATLLFDVDEASPGTAAQVGLAVGQGRPLCGLASTRSEFGDLLRWLDLPQVRHADIVQALELAQPFGAHLRRGELSDRPVVLCPSNRTIGHVRAVDETLRCVVLRDERSVVDSGRWSAQDALVILSDGANDRQRRYAFAAGLLAGRGGRVTIIAGKTAATAGLTPRRYGNTAELQALVRGWAESLRAGASAAPAEARSAKLLVPLAALEAIEQFVSPPDRAAFRKTRAFTFKQRAASWRIEVEANDVMNLGLHETEAASASRNDLMICVAGARGSAKSFARVLLATSIAQRNGELLSRPFALFNHAQRLARRFKEVSVGPAFADDLGADTIVVSEERAELFEALQRHRQGLLLLAAPPTSMDPAIAFLFALLADLNADAKPPPSAHAVFVLAAQDDSTALPDEFFTLLRGQVERRLEDYTVVSRDPSSDDWRRDWGAPDGEAVLVPFLTPRFFDDRRCNALGREFLGQSRGAVCPVLVGHEVWRDNDLGAQLAEYGGVSVRSLGRVDMLALARPLGAEIAQRLADKPPSDDAVVPTSDIDLSASERRAAACLRKYKLAVTKRPEGAAKNPDFDVTTDDGFSFLAEVKAVLGPGENEPLLWQRLYNATTADIRNAAKQFESVNGERTKPNVIVLVAEDFRVHVQSMYDFMKGEIVVDGEQIADLRRYRFGRVKDAFAVIDLFIILDMSDTPSFFFTSNDPRFLEMLTSVFGFAVDSEKK